MRQPTGDHSSDRELHRRREWWRRFFCTLCVRRSASSRAGKGGSGAPGDPSGSSREQESPVLSSAFVLFQQSVGYDSDYDSWIAEGNACRPRIDSFRRSSSWPPSMSTSEPCRYLPCGEEDEGREICNVLRLADPHDIGPPDHLSCDGFDVAAVLGGLRASTSPAMRSVQEQNQGPNGIHPEPRHERRKGQPKPS